MRTLNLEGLIAIGGEDTLGAAARLHDEHGLPVLGVPKTIDNDLGGTDMTFGFDTAVQIATDAIDRLHTTAESHNRVMIVEVMGRHAGWIALHSGLAGGADVILIPERPFDIDEVVPPDPPPPLARPLLLDRRRGRGRDAQGGHDRGGRAASKDEFGHERLGGIGQLLEREIERAHRLRDARHRARPHPARRHADRLRPRARHPPRPRRDRRRARAALGHDARAARHAGSSSCRSARRSRSCAPCRPRTTRPPRRSSARGRLPPSSTGGELAAERLVEERLDDHVGGGADHQRHRQQEGVEGLDPERPGRDPPDQPDRERHVDDQPPPGRGGSVTPAPPWRARRVPR